MDIALFRLINNFSGRMPWLDMIGVFVAEYLIIVMVLDVMVHADIAIYHMVRRRSFERLSAIVVGLRAGVAVVGALATNAVIGLIWYRPRPFLVLENVNKLITKGAEKSFPSDHATFAFALAFSVFFLYRRWGIAMLILATFVAVGRIFVGVHYPSDVVVGAVMGLVWALIARAIGEKVNDRAKLTSYFTQRLSRKV